MLPVRVPEEPLQTLTRDFAEHLLSCPERLGLRSTVMRTCHPLLIPQLHCPLSYSDPEGSLAHRWQVKRREGGGDGNKGGGRGRTVQPQGEAWRAWGRHPVPAHLGML